MAAYTNMAWPEDPYGTGQLWRKEPPLLAAFAACCVDDQDSITPVGYAVVYLRLHRTKPVDATHGISFGFRAVSAVDLAELVRLFDLDTMRARRLGKITAGHRLADDLHAVDLAIRAEAVGRGVRALADAWADPQGGQDGMAVTVDTAHHHGGELELADAAAASAIDITTVRRAFQHQHTLDLLFEAARGIVPPGTPPPSGGRGELSVQAAEALAVHSTERALISALIAARHLERYTWKGDLDIDAILATNVWDCFPSQDFSPQDQPA